MQAQAPDSLVFEARTGRSRRGRWRTGRPSGICRSGRRHGASPSACRTRSRSGCASCGGASRGGRPFRAASGRGCRALSPRRSMPRGTSRHRSPDRRSAIKGRGTSVAADLARCHEAPQGAAIGIRHRMQLGVQPALRSPDEAAALVAARLCRLFSPGIRWIGSRMDRSGSEVRALQICSSSAPASYPSTGIRTR